MDTKIDLTEVSNTEAFGFIYNLDAKIFLLSNTWKEFASEIIPKYKLLPRQLHYILTEWNLKEEILK